MAEKKMMQPLFDAARALFFYLPAHGFVLPFVMPLVIPDGA